ncbi:hypothetical protein [Actinocatenispora rupis]|uniref:Uncharacterized protein n=1 Tax=Actinocatenispora rupis TaxID=519421 RepID=A0A8J3JC90_9ACTN|nr:hypothetical protein [Actinocatenispora rupis]GID15691.1 hypothetical protein Aru02nite_65800 [Actinocatenispora rupis]
MRKLKTSRWAVRVAALAAAATAGALVFASNAAAADYGWTLVGR